MKLVSLGVSVALALNLPLTALAGEQTPSAAQIAMIRDAGCSLTQIIDAPIYDADGYIVKGRLNECSQDRPWLDVSVGGSAPKRGEKLIFVSGRYLVGQHHNIDQSLIFQRGRPNVSYAIKGDIAQAMFVSGTLPHGTYDWKNAQLVLPFMPTEVHDQGDMGGGRHWYAYGGLKFVPGHERDAYPLDANSIVIAIDGISFNAPLAFSTPLEYPAPGQRYLEVIYFQSGDVNGPMRRAYIPVFPKASIPQWDAMVDSNPLFQPNYAGIIRVAMVITAFGGAMYALSNSGVGQQIREDYEACERSIRPTTMIC